MVRALRRSARAAYRLAKHSPLGPLARSRSVRVARQRMLTMPERDAVTILTALTEAEVRFWVAGGWGIDALLERQTRRHSDLDLVLDLRRDDENRARQVLAQVGLRFENPEAIGDSRLPRVIQLHDRAGRVVDLLPVDLISLPIISQRHPSRRDTDGDADPDSERPYLFAEGTIGSRTFPCLAPGVQLALHQGYDLSASDRNDVNLLCDRFGFALP